MALLKKQWRVIAIAAAMTAAAVFTAIVVGGGCTDEPKNPVTPGGGGEQGRTFEELVALYEKSIAGWGDYENGVPLETNADGDQVTLGDGSSTFVGCAINLFKGPTFKEAVKGPLIAPAVYAGTHELIDVAKYHDENGYGEVSDNLSDVYSNFDIDAKIGTGDAVPFFSGDVSASYGRKRKLMSQSKFYQYFYHIIQSRHTLQAHSYATLAQRKRNLIPEALEIIDDPDVSPQSLFDMYGTHMITGCGMGGSTTIFALYESEDKAEDTDIKAALNFKSAYVEGHAETNINDKQKYVQKNTTMTVMKSGGLGSFAGADIEHIAPELKAWAGTVDADPTIGKLYDLVGIWELATKPERADVLKKAFIKRAGEIDNDLRGYFTKGMAPVIPDTPVVYDGATYIIQNWFSQRALAFNEEVVLTTRTDTSSKQQWVAVRSWTDTGYFSFKCNFKRDNKESVLTGHLNGHPVDTQRNLGEAEQLFKVVKNSDGSVFLLSKKDEAYKVGTKNPETTAHVEGTLLWMVTNSDNKSKWKLVKIKD